MPPTKPSMVFLGLILINLVFPITLPMKYEKISKVIIIIIKRLNNLEWMTFKISEDKKYTRLIKVERGEVVSFHFKIVEGIFDLTKILSRKELDDFNKTLIDVGILKNKYLERSPYFYMKATVLFDILSTMEVNGLLSSFNFLAEIDNKLEEDDPVLTVKTDYTPY